MTGRLTRVLDEEVRVEVGPYEYQILVPEFVRRQLQARTGGEVTLFISEYYEGNSVGSKFIPRKLGFLAETEQDFFDLFCTVDKIGTKKALKAMGRPIREIADAIQRQDVKWLTTLPGIGKSGADQIIATLKAKVARYALAPAMLAGVASGNGETSGAEVAVDPQLFDDAYMALMAVGLSPIDARDRLDIALKGGPPPKDAQELVNRAFKK